MGKNNKLKEILEERGTTQMWLVRKTGLRPSTINELVQQRRGPTLETARKIAKALGKRLEDVWPEDDA